MKPYKPYVYEPPCPGSYTDAVPNTVKHLRRVVTGECPVCGRRVAYTGNWDRKLGRHQEKSQK
jgi:hypothetical protein